MDITYNKVDQTALPISQDRVSASEYNQIAASLMNIITSAGLTPDSQDNAQLLNALGPRIVETYSNGTSWYRVWSDGWCEQGGLTSGITGNTNSVALLKTFASTSFTVQLTPKSPGAITYTPAYNITSASTINIGLYNDTAAVCWRAEGYLASGD